MNAVVQRENTRPKQGGHMRHTRKHKRSQCGDFYTRVNGRWRDRAVIPPTETRITQAYYIRREIDRELADVIGKAERSPGPIQDLLASWDAAVKEPIPSGLTSVLMTMLESRTTSDVSARIGWMCRHGIGSPLSVYVQGDPRDYSRCRVVIEEGSPYIGIPEYWLWNEYAGHRRAYKHYVRELARILALPALTQGLPAEHEFADMYPPAVPESQQPPINMRTWSELQSEFSVMDWPTLMRSYGFSDEQMQNYRYNVTTPAFVHHLQRRLKSWTPERWAGWLALLVVQWAAGMCPHGPLRTAWFNYTRRFLQGMKSDFSPAFLRTAIVSTLMPNRVGKLWVHDYCSPTLKRSLTAMAERIRTAAITAMKNNSWMSASTKTAAATKLRRLDIQVCWPDKWTSLDPTLSPDNLIENLMSIGSTATDASIEYAQKHDCRDTHMEAWPRPVYEVNAFYYPNDNKFLLPAAILRPPFYDTSKSLVWNYAAIGSTIGHELCHAFDAEGRRYDENGDRRNWWTPKDEREYKSRAERVVSLYESVPYRGLSVNGRLTLVENIADLGGLEFSMAGLRSALGRELTKDEKKEFFTAYAISWRAKDRLKRAAELLITDPHAPPALRVSHAVRQFDEWYEAFDIKETCEEYIPPAKRIHFFA